MNKNGAATAFMLDDFDYDILSKSTIPMMDYPALNYTIQK